MSSLAPDAERAPVGQGKFAPQGSWPPARQVATGEHDGAGRHETTHGREAPARRQPQSIRPIFGGAAFGSLHADFATMPPGRPPRTRRHPSSPLVFKWFCRRSPFSQLPFGPLCHTGFFAVQFRADGVARLNELWQENARPRRSVARPIGGQRCCGSSVVEHSLGKGEVESSILSRSTINSLK